MSEPLDLDNDDVVDMSTHMSFVSSQMSTFLAFKQGLEQFFSAKSGWLSSGATCRVLRTSGGGWQKGKFRLRLEFIPDAPPPPKPDSLDEMRAKLNQPK